MTYSTKYEDIPPRYRKTWIKGHEELIQGKISAPAEELNTIQVMPLGPSVNSAQASSTLSVAGPSMIQSPAVSRNSSIGDLTPNIQVQHLVDELKSQVSREGIPVGQIPEIESDRPISFPILYNTPAMQRIIDSVVDMNVSRSTPSSSRASSPIPRHRHNRHQAGSLSRPSTRHSSPSGGPSGWVALTARHSHRRFDIRPWGPRHLEYDYHMAYKEFQSAAYYALGQFGYFPTRGISQGALLDTLPSMADLRKIKYFQKACKELDNADRALEEALAKGRTWDNTPVPDEYHQYSLEELSPEDMCRERPDNTSGLDRKRSSVALEEEAITSQQIDTNDHDQPERGIVSNSINNDIMKDTSNRVSSELDALNSSKVLASDDFGTSSKASRTTVEGSSVTSNLRRKREFDDISSQTSELSSIPTRPVSPVARDNPVTTSPPISVRGSNSSEPGKSSVSSRGRGRPRGGKGGGRGKGRSRGSKNKKK